MHPYLLPLGFSFGVLLIARQLKYFPRRLLVTLGVWAILYILAALRGPGGINESVKIGAAVATVVTGALLVRTERDVLLGALGLTLAGAIIALRGFQNIQGIGVGANALEGVANENAVSLYTLPALLLAGIALRDLRPGRLVGWILVIAIVLISTNTFLSANRSGWIGVAVVALLLVVGSKKKVRMGLLLGVAAFLCYYLFLQFDTRAFFRSLELTLQGGYHDSDRLSFIITSFEIGLDNPILGVSPTLLPYEIARRLVLYSTRMAHAPHNVFGHLVGGTGFIVFSAFIYLGFLLWRRPPTVARSEVPVVGMPAAWAHWLLRMMLILWVARGFFTHEILYSPSFCLALGMLIGLCSVKGVWPQVPRRHFKLKLRPSRKRYATRLR